jgi:hypothetical protein
MVLPRRTRLRWGAAPSKVTRTVRISEARFFLIAAGLHAALPVMAAIVPTPVIEVESVPIEVQIEVQVEQTRPPTVTEMPAARVEAPRPAEETPTPRIEPRPPSAAHVEPGPTAAPSVEPTADPGAVPAPGPAATGTSEYTTPAPIVQTGPITGLPGLGGPAWTIPGAVPDMGKPAPAPTTAPKATVDPKIATKVLTEAVKEKDKALGIDLPVAGKIASAVRSAVQATDVPVESRATFEVKLSPTGQVVSVRVASASAGSSDAWKRAEAQVKAMVAGLSGVMKAGYEKGAVVSISVHSTTTLPDGSKSAIERKGVGATFDLANIGAHMQRVTKTSFSVAAIK